MGIVEQHQPGKGFEVQVLGGNKAFYDAIEGKKLRDLTFPESLYHPWTAPAIAARCSATSWQATPLFYTLYDRGRNAPAEGATVHVHEEPLFPSIYARAVWEQIHREAGYQATGQMPELIDRLVLPVTRKATVRMQ